MDNAPRPTGSPDDREPVAGVSPDPSSPVPLATPAPRRAGAGRIVTRRTVLLGGAAALLTIGGAAWWAADRFLIPHVEVADVTSYEAQHVSSEASAAAEAAASATAAATTTLTDTTFSDGATSIALSTVSTGSGSSALTYYVADVTLGDATALRSAFADDQFGENIIQTTSEIAQAHGAVFAINGDYYGFRSTGIEIRNGAVYRDEPARQGLAFFLDGRVEVYDETQTSADALLAAGVWNTVSFGPAIVENGTAVAGIDSVEIDTNVGNHSIQGDQPRTAIGVIGDNHLVFVVVDGRQEGYSAGVTLPELAEILISLGATTGYNLDGGGSSTMYFNGSVVNSPSNGGERGTSDILYVAG